LETKQDLRWQKCSRGNKKLAVKENDLELDNAAIKKVFFFNSLNLHLNFRVGQRYNKKGVFLTLWAFI
jgi:hypothetical protein